MRPQTKDELIRQPWATRTGDPETDLELSNPAAARKARRVISVIDRWHRPCLGDGCDLGAPCKRHRRMPELAERYLRMKARLPRGPHAVTRKKRGMVGAIMTRYRLAGFGDILVSVEVADIVASRMTFDELRRDLKRVRSVRLPVEGKSV